MHNVKLEARNFTFYIFAFLILMHIRLLKRRLIKCPDYPILLWKMCNRNLHELFVFTLR